MPPGSSGGSLEHDGTFDFSSTSISIDPAESGRRRAGLSGWVAGKVTGLARTDEILVSRCQKGDKKAFELLIEKYQRRIFHLIYRMTQDPDLVEPLAQEVFLKAYRSIQSFRGHSQFYTWLYRIAVNTCLSQVKKTSLEDTREDVELNLRNTAPEADSMHPEDPEQLFLRKEFLTRLMDSVRDLPEELRTAIVLREFTGLNYEEIAETMDIPLGTVRSRIFRARARLREVLEPYL